MAGQQGHPPGQGPFDQFIALMNHDDAKDLVRSINMFMKSFKQSTPDADADSKAVQGFLQQMETAMAKHPLFANTSPQEQDAVTEALEKYLMTKLYERTFRRGADDVERDEVLAVRCEALGFVAPHHLEIPPGVVDEVQLGRAVEELNKINRYKAPRDKLVCILNCCSMINTQLTRSTKAEGIGADDFTPLLIYVVLKARPPALASNLAYIERYRYHPRLTAEAQYYYIQLCGAATFIEMINASSLKVDRDEFIAHMLAAGAMTDEQLASLQSGNSHDMAAAAAAAAGGQPAASGVSGPQQQRSHAPSATQQSILRSTQAAAAAATAAGIQPSDWHYGPTSQQQQQHQQQQSPQLQMQALPLQGQAAAAEAAWPQVALGHNSTGWPYDQPNHQQQQQQQVTTLQQQQGQQQQQSPLPPLLLPSVSDLEALGAGLLAQGDPSAAARQLVSRHSFCCSSLDSLSLGDVTRLLSAYKELVLRYEALAAAVEHLRAKQQQQGPGTVGAAAAAAGQVQSSTQPSGPTPPSTAAAGEALTPPSSTGGGDAVVLPPLSPQPTAAVVASGSAAAAAAAATSTTLPEDLQPKQQQQQKQQGSAVAAADNAQQGASTADRGSSAGGQAAAAAAAAPSAAAPAHDPAAAVHPSSAQPQQQQPQQQQPAAAQLPAPSAALPPPADTPTSSSRPPQQQQQQQESSVDDLLQSLLSPADSATPTGLAQAPAAVAVGQAAQHSQQQQLVQPQAVKHSSSGGSLEGGHEQQQQVHQTATGGSSNDDDLFGLFQGGGSSSAGGSDGLSRPPHTTTTTTTTPSLLD